MDYNDFYQDERRREQGQLTESLPSYTAKTFLWMFLGLLTTFGVAVGCYVSGLTIYAFLSIPAFHMIILVAELAGWLEGRLRQDLRHTPEDLGIDAEAWAGQMVSRLTYSIEDVELSGDAAVVGVHVWAPRAGEIVSKASEGMSTYFYNQGVRDGEPLSEDLQEDVLRTFETTTESAPVEERTLGVALTRSDNGFAVDERALERDLLNAFDAIV